MIIFFRILFPFGIFRISISVDVQVPHCTRLWATKNDQEHSVYISAQLDISETLCFVVPYNSAMQRQFGELGHDQHRKSILIALTHESTQQEYYINRGTHVFSIPKVEAHCTCDCHGTKDNCNANFKSGSCTHYATHRGVCVRTYRNAEAAEGCPQDAAVASEVCCEILLKPTEHQYKVINLNGFSTTYQLRYHIFDHTSASDGDLSRLPVISYGTVKGSSVTSHENIIFPFLKTHTTTSLHRILSRGSLVIPLMDGVDDEPRTLENNVVSDYGKGDLSEVGWFQQNTSTGRWGVPAGHAKINHALELVATSCKDQQYGFDLVAWHFRTGPPEVNETLGVKASQYFYNVRKTNFKDSSHPVLYVEPIRSLIDLKVYIHGISEASFVNHSSHVGDFGGEIRIDQFGNRYVYIVLEQASGSIFFSVQGVDQTSDITFGEYVASREPRSVRKLKRITSWIDSDRYICVWADQMDNHKRCRLFKLNKEPLREVEFREHGYIPGQSSCPGCNDFKSKTFLSWLNPVKWFSDGVQGFSQSLAVTTDVAIAVIILILLLCVCRKCVWPLICSAPKIRKR